MLLGERAEKKRPLSSSLPVSSPLLSPAPRRSPSRPRAVRQPRHLITKKLLLPGAQDVLVPTTAGHGLSTEGALTPGVSPAMPAVVLCSSPSSGGGGRGGAEGAGAGAPGGSPRGDRVPHRPGRGRPSAASGWAPDRGSCVRRAPLRTRGDPRSRCWRRRHGRGSGAQGRRGAGGAPAARSGTGRGARAAGTPPQGPQALPGAGRPR